MLRVNRHKLVLIMQTGKKLVVAFVFVSAEKAAKQICKTLHVKFYSVRPETSMETCGFE